MDTEINEVVCHECDETVMFNYNEKLNQKLREEKLCFVCPFCESDHDDCRGH